MCRRNLYQLLTILLLFLYPLTAGVAAEKTAQTDNSSDCKTFVSNVETNTGNITLDSDAVLALSKQRQTWISSCAGDPKCEPLAPKVNSSDGNKVTLSLEQILEIERARQLWMEECAETLALNPITTETQTGGKKPEPGQFQAGVVQPRQEDEDPEPVVPEKPIVVGACPDGYTDLSPSAPVVPTNVDRVIRADSEEDEGATVTLRWGPGYIGKTPDCVNITPPDSYRICAFRGSDCYSSGARQIWDNIPASQTQMAVIMDDGHFQGENFHWAVMACSEDAYCGAFSVQQPIRYMLPPPTNFWVSTIVRNEMDPENPFSEITFRWSSVYRAELYFLCVTTQPLSDCDYLKTPGAFGDPFIKSKSRTRYKIDRNLQQFRGRTVRYTVAACTNPDTPSFENCSFYQTPKTMNYPDPQ